MGVLFTIVIATHKRYELLIRAVNSILNQSYKHNQLIVVSDAIDAETNNICNVLRENDMFIIKPGAKGPSESRNIGIQNARGEFILFLDDDDSYEPTYLEAISKALEDPQYHNAILYTNSRIIYPNENLIQDVDTSSKPFESAYVKNFVHSNAVIYPTALIKDTRFDLDLIYEDWEFLLAAASGHVAKHINIFGPIVFDDRTIERRNENSQYEKIVDCYVKVYNKYSLVSESIHIARKNLLRLDDKTYRSIIGGQ